MRAYLTALGAVTVALFGMASIRFGFDFEASQFDFFAGWVACFVFNETLEWARKK